MIGPGPTRFVVIGGGSAGRAAMAELPGAVLIARPDATAWHAEPGLVWVEGAGRVWAEPFDVLLVCAEEPLLLAALGCAVSTDRIVADGEGRTSVPGVSVVHRAVGDPDVERRAVAAARALRVGHADAVAPPVGSPPPARLDPMALAALLERPGGPERDAEALAQHAVLGALVPARPVGLAALAGLVATMPDAIPPQRDGGERA